MAFTLLAFQLTIASTYLNQIQATGIRFILNVIDVFIQTNIGMKSLEWEIIQL